MGKRYCSKAEREEYEKTKKVCKVCGTEFYKSWSKWSLSDFCSKSCSKKYSSTIKREEVNKKVSESLKKYHSSLADGEYKKKREKLANDSRKQKEKIYYANPNYCFICNKVIPFDRKRYKTCSNECAHKAIVKTKLEKGYYDDPNRHFVTSCCGYYKGHYCGSTYELVYTIYNLDHNIPFERNKKGFLYVYEGKSHTYYPDYITPDGYVEIKGMWTDKVDVKLAAVKDPIKILYKKDLKYAFDYVSQKYLNGKKSGWQSLYDNHKPKYEKVCPQCGITFYRDVNDRKFCCHACSVKYYTRKRRDGYRLRVNRSSNIPEGFVEIPTLDGYYINDEKRVWSSWSKGSFLKLHNVKGRRNKYNIRNKWFFPDELYEMTFNSPVI